MLSFWQCKAVPPSLMVFFIFSNGIDNPSQVAEKDLTGKIKKGRTTSRPKSRQPLFHLPIPPKLLSFLRLPSLPLWYFSPRPAATPPASAITGSQEVTAAPEHCIQCAQKCNAAIPADAMVHGAALKRREIQEHEIQSDKSDSSSQIC